MATSSLPDDSLVLDASVALAMALGEPLAGKTAALFVAWEQSGVTLLAPALFDAECANGLVKAVRRERVTGADAVAAMVHLLMLPVQRLVSPTASLVGMQLALRHGISAHDGVYVALAEEEGLPLITADARLVRSLAYTPHDVRLLADVAGA